MREELNVKTTNFMRWEQDRKKRVDDRYFELQSVERWEVERKGNMVQLIVEKLISGLSGDEWASIR